MSRAHLAVRTFAPALAAVVAALSSVASAAAAGDRCQGLGPVHVVSYKGQESKIFDSVIAMGADSTKKSFDAPEVLRIFSACLASLKAGDEEGDAAVSRILADVAISVSDDATSAGLRVGKRPTFALALSGPGGRLAKILVGRTLRELEVRNGERAAVSNALWFLWIESYVRSLGDRFNTYRYADELAADAALRQGRSYSVGFQPVLRERKVYADKVFDDSLRAGGLADGTEVATLDGRPILDLSPSEFSRYWLSPRPFAYRVAGRRDGKPFELTAQTVFRRYPTIAWTTQGDLAYLRISRFAVESVIELRRVLRAVERAGVRGLVIDVRSNPGGVSSPGFTDCFLKPGQTTMSYRETRTGKEVDVDATVEYHDLPIAVLVDGDSASMAEAFAAAIQVHKRGVLFGTRTFGKGVGQTIREILNEGTLHLVERTYFFPGTRESWDRKGVTPDVVVETGKEEAERVRAFLETDAPRIDDPATIDAVLAKAIERLGAHP